MSILIKNILLGNKKTDIYVEGSIIKKIEKNIKEKAEFVIDGNGKAAIPGLVNSHTHAAMTLFRSYADDMSLQEWLEKKIWPLEAKLTEKDVYWGTKLACLEMIKSGTTCFNDMYWHLMGSAKAVEEMGIRAVLTAVLIDFFDSKKAEEQIKLNKRLFDESRKFSKRIVFALGPHAIYSVSKESLLWCKEFAEENNLLIHIHLSETAKEVKDCLKQHKMRPAEYLGKIGFLGPNVIACHSVWLNEKEIKILAENKVNIAHNPVSNMKLAVGDALHYEEMRKHGLNVCLGTDGCASNNNLDMFESMKFAALLQKAFRNKQTLLPANEAFEMATINGAKALRINAGEIKEGKLADILLIDLKRPELTPNHNLISNLVYSANGSCVDTLICDGKIIMENRKVKGEEEILENAQKAAFDILSRK
ncbi:MAG: amidohydrolase [Candidatus Woesearchaeota archaeon]|nr:amidohydrolase [Candidatus Woesearchaeota archaeon]